MKLIYIAICAIVLLITPCSAIVVPSHRDYYNPTLIWKSEPFDAYNATPLNSGEYYLVDEYLFIYPDGGDLRLNYVFMSWNGEVYCARARMVDYYMNRIPDVGGKYTVDSWMGGGNYYAESYRKIQ
jgi:hypothetical protein